MASLVLQIIANTKENKRSKKKGRGYDIILSEIVY
jgi:hypothetical protein